MLGLAPLFKKTVADSNAPVQEKALDALIAFLRTADADVGRYGRCPSSDIGCCIIWAFVANGYNCLLDGFCQCRYAKEVCDAVVAKCLTGRPKTVEKSQAAFLLWVELEAADAFLVRS